MEGRKNRCRIKKPPFTITEKILTDVMEICELVGKVSSTQHLSSDSVLRRQNRIKTIYSSLAIEQNTLSLEQVTAVLSGKRVLAPPKDIAEVKNAYEIYDHLNELNPYSVEDLLLAHHVMMRGLVQEDGVFRSKPVGVVDSHGNVLHFGTLPQYVPPLVEELLKRTRIFYLHLASRQKRRYNKTKHSRGRARWRNWKRS